jgi:hypothetical protein
VPKTGHPPGHPAVGADQPLRRVPRVAALAAEPHGGGDEDADRHQQHHEDDQDQQEQHRVHPLGRGQRIPEPFEPGDPVVEPGREALRAAVEGEFLRADQPALPDGADDLLRQPVAQQLALVGLQQPLQCRGDHHLVHAGQLVEAGRYGSVRPLGLQHPPPDVHLAEGRAGVGDQQGVVALLRLRLVEQEVRAGALPVVTCRERVRDRGREQQQRHPEPDADGGQQGADPPLTPAREREPEPQAQVPGPLPQAHTTRSMSRDLPSRTTISRSE